MKKIIKIIFIILFILSLGLNILLIYSRDKINCDIPSNNGSNNDVYYSKLELGDHFKNYQASNNLAKSDDVVIWNIDKITYKGFFMSDGTKVYFIDETFSCINGTDCVNAANPKVDDNYNSKATFVVIVNENDKQNPTFTIVDEDVLKDNDFISETEIELK